MTLEFHAEVQRDFNAAIAYYESEAGIYVADRFETELRAALAAISSAPRQFPFCDIKRQLRRIRLQRFPYVIVYRECRRTVRVTILKHESQRPSFGVKRR